ncbi:MAG: hypothetical protein HY340_01425 [Candidatus Kerfeldbacteria bacterium]|nr:hypothetical protein [Candidatus Kerfeldbacteria bacterium]
MIQRNYLVLATILAGSLGLATLGVVRASSIDSEIATPVATVVTADETSSTAAAPMLGRGMHHLQQLEEQAKLFRMTTDDLIAAIESGKPMYQIAAEHGVTYTAIKEQRLAEFRTRLDDMVKVGYMTQAQADEVFQQMQTQPMLGLDVGHHGGRWAH